MLKTIRINFDRHEARRDRRYALPPIMVALDTGSYATNNWSLGGFLLPPPDLDLVPNLDLPVGASVAGQVTLPDGSTPHAFRAEVVRRDADGTGFRFVEPLDALVGALDRAIAHRLFRKRA
jgi:hypothetical protein